MPKTSIILEFVLRLGTFMLKVAPAALLVFTTTASCLVDWLVIPGIRLGQVRLGATRAQVHSVLKKPTLQRTLTNGICEESWRTRLPYGYKYEQKNGAHWKYHFVNVYFQHNCVVQIETNSPRFHTREGLSVQSSIGTKLNQLLEVRLSPHPDHRQLAASLYQPRPRRHSCRQTLPPHQ